MEIKIHAEGNHFEKSSDIKSLITMLAKYESTYTQCLKISAQKYELSTTLLSPRVKLTAVSPGSINICLVTEIATAFAPLAPQIFNYTWLLYKSGYDLIGIASKHFKSTEKPMNIEINNSPGAIINIVQGDQVTTTSDVLTAASVIHKGFYSLAQLIKENYANMITISSPKEHILFDDGNCNTYPLPSKVEIETEITTIECNITRFNKRSLLGSIDVFYDNESIAKPFVATPDILDECLENFKSQRVTARTHKEVEVNALGETTISKYHLIGFEID
ncbi:hypothetical protein DO021_21815 [Desulfobacter hydrogenophilus]|uniref:Uncharacterized protein n=1 Tax=Desulfobacter hydrogenophilus TaxID=2291 RepID=A0A328F9W4_9BACT|nr:hypothetical protein [Desulfobacter hydrogenophilus]NDY74616.1 hypothetical protein [Desulfobacter hydrogenophilus]QBH14284.1 hypothetical protein EYB58_16000 [Desulfobacter hydrogenophilus]RAL99924.1 hypothetical protein DO021_21815 [Desulfobacter hydrogenophilus]